MISIVIPFYGKFELVHQRMNEIFSFLPDVEVVLVNDASPDDDGSIRLITWWQRVFGDYGRTLRYVKNPKNLGFGGAMNEGVRHARCDTVVLLSNDVVVSGDFTKQIEEILRLDPNVLIGGESIYFDSGWNVFECDGKPFIVPYLNGWLLTCTKEVWNRLGGFDPLYGRFDYEDMDLSMTAHSLGIRLVPLHSSHLRHIGGQTISSLNTNRQAITEENRKKFTRKWEGRFPEIFERMEKAHGGH